MKQAASGASSAAAAAFGQTLNLPKTAFPMRASAAVREKLAVRRLTADVFHRQRKAREGVAEAFVLHDGPPYANGALHMGHLLNKTLKDIANRAALLEGKFVQFLPGWDCHGLPIEIKALEALTASGTAVKSLSPMAVRAAARAWAEKAITAQAADFERWAVMADWSGAPGTRYLTMDPKYEAAQLEVFRSMLDQGWIRRGVKPVYWSPSSETALAEAELEYKDDHKSHAAFIGFKITAAKIPQLQSLPNPHLLIWTTTPWTIPANAAVCVHKDIEYSIVQVANPALDASHVVVATTRIPELKDVLGTDYQVVGTVRGSDLTGTNYVHPFLDRQSQVFTGDHVTDESGTGLVHTAPGHGHEDFELTAHADVPVFCPVDDFGKFTAAAGANLAGLPVLTEGNKAVLQMLKDRKKVAHSHTLVHKYPYDWRTKQPVIIRATAQWFANVSKLHGPAVDALSQVTMVPQLSRNRLSSMVASRDEWCISRQRSWGVPIPVFYHKETKEALMNTETIDHLIGLVKQHGTDCWWTMSIAELLPPKYAAQADTLVKGTDTLDVWFDSGTSWRAAWACSSMPAPKQADLVLEGSDQHRGWFQSALLTHLPTGSGAPYKTIVTHGFVLDESGYKMSKSLGNVVLPMQIIDGTGAKDASVDASKLGKQKKSKSEGKAAWTTPYGVDIARLWAASSDFSKDVLIGPTVVEKVAEVARKLRNTGRFILGNLYDYQVPGSGSEAQRLLSAWQAPISVNPRMLQPVDAFLLSRLAQFRREVQSSYSDFSYNKVVMALNLLASNDLSALYFDVTKDRLYAERADSPQRRATQAVLWEALRTMTLAMAPILPFLADDLYQHSAPLVGFEPNMENPPFTVFDVTHQPLNANPVNMDVLKEWVSVLSVRDHLNQLLEIARKEGAIGSALEASVFVRAPAGGKVARILSGMESTLADVFVTSQAALAPAPSHTEAFKYSTIVPVSVAHSGASVPTYPGMPEAAVDLAEQVYLEIRPARGHKCARCWRYSPSVSTSSTTICDRCAQALGQ